jgi:uncharacterized protein
MRNLVGTLWNTAPLIHRNPGPRGWIKRAKYCLRGLAFPRETMQLIEFLQRPELAFIVKHNPGLFHKLQRPYLTRTLSIPHRLEALKQHYKFVLAHFSQDGIKELYTNEDVGKLLFELNVPEVGTLEMRLCCGRMQKEGDLTFCLEVKETGKRIGSLSFSIWKYEADYKEIFIGGLQGNKATKEDTVVTITRSLYGLRPKALLFFVLQQLATFWNIDRVRGVSDKMHIYRHFQSKRNLAASYDEFWADCDGQLMPDDLFNLPGTFVPRAISTIRVNKRQMYRRRYAMLEGIAEQIRRQMQGGDGPLVNGTINRLAA